ncbi:MAG: aldose epimerase [Actinobacteria bacterium]|uniref:Unannotated protein n=1 Tax=freshwater metagenome TaxID=449393 RepID=A0A6J6P8H7_9ZZZZ|nr:aldose epimerase [Actinomycetota bacterium]
MLGPTGDQYAISAGGYDAVVTQSGGALRQLSHDGRPLIAGFAEDALPDACRGQLLMPWPNRIRDGRYTFAGTEQQLPLTEPSRANASHGLVRWATWAVEEHTSHSVSLTCRVMAQSGYPWTLDLEIVYDLSADGLTVTQSATNLAATAAPYATGAHPYLCVGDGLVDDLELTFPGALRHLTDPERLLPTGTEAVDGTAYDFRVARPLRGTELNHTFSELVRDDAGVATTELRDPRTGQGVTLWVDAQHHCLLLYTADDRPGIARRAIAVEPMSAPPDAFNSGLHLTTLSPGEQHTASWGIRASD